MQVESAYMAYMARASQASGQEKKTEDFTLLYLCRMLIYL